MCTDKAECDWPLAVSCQLTEAQVLELQLPDQVYIYLTIDDFPGFNHGVDKTLDALAEAQVRATFFMVSDFLDGFDLEYKESAIIRAVQEGTKKESKVYCSTSAPP